MTAAVASLTPVRTSRFRRGIPPYLLGLTGATWLVLFFLIPLFTGLLVSLETGSVNAGWALTWKFQVYADIFTDPNYPYGLYLLRSFGFGASATILTIVIGYPVAYFLAFRASARWKNTLLSLVMISFLVSFVVRILMISLLLGNAGPVVTVLQALHLVGENFSFLSTPGAVILGQTYNDLPFMVLPIYVALERIDQRLFEAGGDLYGRPSTSFFRITLPLSRSGIFSGILIVFIDTVGDPVASGLLGGTGTTNFGQQIQIQYLAQQHYNVAAALSTILMLALGIVLVVYARVFGTNNIKDLT